MESFEPLEPPLHYFLLLYEREQRNGTVDVSFCNLLGWSLYTV